jgi:hypothetical protein
VKIWAICRSLKGRQGYVVVKNDNDDEGIGDVMRVIYQWWAVVNIHHIFLKNPL